MAKSSKKQLTFSDQVRLAVETCGQTRYRIAQETHISESLLCRFMSGERGLSMHALDVLAEYLDLELTMAGLPVRKKGR